MNGNFIITGAAQGFGKEFTRRVLKGGGKVVLADKNVEVGEKTCQEMLEQFGDGRCIFADLDVTDRDNWRKMWTAAETFFDNKIDVLVNNAGVSPKLGFDICMKINLDGVLNGLSIFEEKLGKHNGGAGGLIINTASCAGLTQPTRHDVISYFLSKHAVVNITRQFGSSKSVYKTGIKHVALCPWFVETAIVDDQTKKLVLEKSPLKFTTVERVGEAFELAVKEQRTGGLIAVLPNTPLVYYPDMENIQGLVVYFMSKILQLFGVEVCTPQAQGGVLLGLAVILVFFCHFFLNYVGL